MNMDVLSKDFFKARRKDLKDRVKPKRFRHIEGVSETAEKLAEVYGVDTAKARLAGLLHDWDKGMNDTEIKQRAYDLGLEQKVGSWTIEHMPEVLHGPTAATALGREYPEIPDDVLESIFNHTTASLEMSDLDKIIYIADAIEPNRSFDRADELRGLIGEVPLDELYFEVYKFWTLALIEHDRVLHPATIDIWNELAKERSDKQKERYR